MTTTVAVIDEVTGQGRTERMKLRLVSERVTARDLITRRVHEEVAAHNASTPEYFNGLVQPTDAERTLNGYRLRERRQLDPQAQCAKALEAFERNGFMLLAGDQQIEQLDDEVTLTEGAEVTFLKLVPLVGG